MKSASPGGRFLDTEPAPARLVEGLRSGIVEAVNPDCQVRVEAVGPDVLGGTVEDFGVAVIAGEANEGTLKGKESRVAGLVLTDMGGADIESVEGIVNCFFNVGLVPRVASDVNDG